MKITEVKVSKLSEGKVKALASITLDNVFVVTGVKVVEGSKGLFVTMPQTKKEDKYFDIAFPLDKELRTEIQEKVLEAYNK
ncbi:TPA: SpoVG family protein [Clostridium botulinum]|nr:SpoVG family protein [Clostridium botulinum]